MELYQAEWCPHSHNVRQRLTELGIGVTLRQVPADADDRDELRRVADTDEIPVLVGSDGRPRCGEDEILDYLDEFDERRDADEHRDKAREEVPNFEEAARTAAS
ncbi:MAG TPA: glutaredoxin [Gaiellaceae bacterium]